MADTVETQLAVVGGGPGGYAAAFMAADCGLEVTLIDVDPNPGGTCLYRGCIPSKALLHVSRLLTEAREAAHFGLKFDEPEIDLDRVRASTDEVVQRMGQLCKSRKVQYIQGRGTYHNSNALFVYHSDGTEVTVKCEYSILAAGSRPMILGPLTRSDRIMNSTSALRLESIPKRLLVIGGGYIGLELGTVYASLGSEVTCVEMTTGLLPGVDRDLVKPLSKRLEGLFKEILLNTKVADMSEQKNGMKVRLEGENIGQKERVFDKVLVCVGRRPNSSGLGLDNTGVKLDEKGFVQVDEQMQTDDPSIFAIGDIAGEPLLAHKATHEGRVAAQVIAGKGAAFEPQAIPAVVFTDPEIAWCGLTETQAEQQGRDVNVAAFPWGASGRAMTFNRPEGVTKLLLEPETNRVLGVGITGVNAGELIAEGVLAIEMGALAEDLDLVIHPHPTLSETIMESAASLFGTSTHMYRRKREKKEEKQAAQNK